MYYGNLTATNLTVPRLPNEPIGPELFLFEIMGRVRIELTEPEGTRFTVWPATNYGLPTRDVCNYTKAAAICQYLLTTPSPFLQFILN